MSCRLFWQPCRILTVDGPLQSSSAQGLHSLGAAHEGGPIFSPSRSYFGVLKSGMFLSWARAKSLTEYGPGYLLLCPQLSLHAMRLQECIRLNRDGEIIECIRPRFGVLHPFPRLFHWNQGPAPNGVALGGLVDLSQLGGKLVGRLCAATGRLEVRSLQGIWKLLGSRSQDRRKEAAFRRLH